MATSTAVYKETEGFIQILVSLHFGDLYILKVPVHDILNDDKYVFTKVS